MATKKRLIPLINACIKELRKFRTEDEPTNNYGYNEYLVKLVNLLPFKDLDALISDILYDNEVIEVADSSASANVFLFMSLLSDKGIINNIEESEDRYTEDGILYAKKEKVCYPLIALMFADKCDFHMLGARLIPRAIIGGENSIKRLLTKWRLDYNLKLPDNVDVDTFYDTLYVAFVPSPDSLNSIAKPYFNNRSQIYKRKLRQIICEHSELYKVGREKYFKWLLWQGSAIHVSVSVDPSINVQLW